MTYMCVPSDKQNSDWLQLFYIVTFLTFSMGSFVGTNLLMKRMIQDRYNNEISACYVWIEDTEILKRCQL